MNVKLSNDAHPYGTVLCEKMGCYRTFLGPFSNPGKDEINCGTKSHVVPVSRTWDLLLNKTRGNDAHQESPKNAEIALLPEEYGPI